MPSPPDLLQVAAYPQGPAARDRWVLERRSPRARLDPYRPYAFAVEAEAGPGGSPVEVATLFLTNRECPFRCLMCDLWQHTLEETVPAGAIAAQVRYALERLPPARHLKLYNSGSFFDPRAIPPVEDAEIARLCAPFERVIVECHPSFVGERCLEFHRLLVRERQALAASGERGHPCPHAFARADAGGVASPRIENENESENENETAGDGPCLEVAMGLETVHPEVLPRLNKRMTLDGFRKAASRLREAGIALRVFILVRPPWLSEAEGVEWARRSLDFAFECGAAVCSLIPTRAGNGAIEALAAAGQFAPPSLASLEAAQEYGLGLRLGRVFSDLWDIERFAGCPACSGARVERLAWMNRTQAVPPPHPCTRCGGTAR